MVQDIAEEIRAVEENARQTVQNARVEGARLIAAAQNEMDIRLKETKQKTTRFFKENVEKFEAAAEEKAREIGTKEKNAQMLLPRGGKTR
jgi:vacuolar-type H+-ATPase subunit H